MSPAQRGTCQNCSREFSKGGIARHLDSCLPRARGDSLHLIADAGPFWLHLAARSDLRLRELDEFLRAIWLECCGHMSSFEFDRPSRQAVLFEELDDDGLDQRLADRLLPGEACSYTYDYGSSTELRIRRRKGHPQLPPGARIAVLGRNLMPEEPCDDCDADAAFYCTNCQALLCDDCVQEHSVDCEESLLPVVNSPRWGVCGYHGPEEDPRVWPPRARAPRQPPQAPTDPERIVDELFSDPPRNEMELAERLEGLHRSTARRLLVERLAAGEVPREAIEMYPAIFQLLGVQQQVGRLQRIACDEDLAPALRNVALAALTEQAPAAVEQLGDQLASDHLADMMAESVRGILSMAQLDSGIPRALADLLEGIPTEMREHLLGLMGELRRQEGIPGSILYGQALRRPALADVHPMMILGLQLDGDPGALELLEALRDEARDPEARRQLQGAILRARSDRLEAEPESEEDSEAYALVSSCDGQGAYNLLACQPGRDRAWSVATVCIRASQDVRDGMVLPELSEDELEDLVEQFEFQADVFFAEIELATAATLVAEAVARGERQGASLPDDARVPVNMILRHDRGAALPDSDFEPDPPDLAACRDLLESEGFEHWYFDRGDLAGCGIPLPPASPSRRAAWLKGANKRIDTPEHRQRLAGMCEHMAHVHDWEGDMELAARCLALFQRISQQGLRREALVRAMLERSAELLAGSRPPALTAGGELGDADLRETLRRSFFREGGAKRGRDMAHLDLTEAAVAALEGIFAGLPGEQRPRQDIQRRSAYQAAGVFCEAAIRSAAVGAPADREQLVDRMADTIFGVAKIGSQHALDCAAALHAALQDFVDSVCNGCPLRCLARPKHKMQREFHSSRHPGLTNGRS